MNKVLIHFQPSYRGSLQLLGYDFKEVDNELDVILPDVEYKNGNHPDMNGIWEDPDVQFCNHYNIDYNAVNCIEAYNFCAV